MTEAVTSPLPVEQTTYRDYERRRRLRLATTLLPILAAIQFGVCLVSILLLFGVHYTSPYEQLFMANTALVGIDAGLHFIGYRLALRDQVGPATLAVVIPAGLTILVPALSYSVVGRYAPVANSPLVPICLSVVTASTVLIVLAGLLFTTRAALLGTTLAINCFSVYIMASVLSVPDIGAAMTSGAPLLLAFPVFVQWATAGILYATSETYVRTLQELGEVRIAYQRQQQLDQLKDQFISHINHELRNPVMALLGHVELLLLTDETLTREERHQYLERAKRSGDQMASLVSGILAARGLEQDAHHFQPEAVDIRDAVTEAIDLIDPRDGRQVERELQLDIPDGLAVWAGPVRVRQILTNLLSNAVKYSAPGTAIEVRAETVWPEKTAKPGGKTESDLVDISIQDHGLGIPPDQIPLLFNRFVRLPRDLASNVPGNGLGLYLCQAYAGAMGGGIAVESAGIEGEGSTFHLRLPLAEPMLAAVPDATTVPASTVEE
jgi:signal transduction histidine kinase